MKIAFDTEFLDSPLDGEAAITLVSVGMVREDGATLHVKLLADDDQRWDLASYDWLRENVRPHLRTAVLRTAAAAGRQIAEFVGGDPEFYAYVGSYDWVALMSLYGPLVRRPASWPSTYIEVKTMFRGTRPPRIGKQHDAVDDAKYVMECLRHVGVLP